MSIYSTHHTNNTLVGFILDYGHGDVIREWYVCYKVWSKLNLFYKKSLFVSRYEGLHCT